MPEHALVFDFGTTYFKAAVVSQGSTLLARARVPTPSACAGGRCEMSAAEFIDTLTALALQLANQRHERLSDIAAITFSSQANTFRLLDRNDSPLTPFIVWTDDRAKHDCDDTLTLALDPDYVRRSGIPALNHQFSISKLAWLSRHEPALFQQAARVEFLADFFIDHFCGSQATDGSIAGLSGMFDVVNWRWDESWCSRVGIAAELLPRVVRAGISLGHIKADQADTLGLPRNCLVVMGLLDQFAGAIGVGNVDVGDVSETTGTVLATVRCADSFTYEQSGAVYRGPSPWPNRFYHLCFSEVGGGLLETLREAAPSRPDLETIDNQVDETAIPPLRIDHHRPIEEIRAQIRAWAREQPVPEIANAVYRAVAAELKDQLRVLDSARQSNRVLAAGGAARSAKWLRIKSDVIGIPVVAPVCDDPNLLGAARVAFMGLNARETQTRREHDVRA